MHYRPVPRARVDASSLNYQDLQQMNVMSNSQAAGYRDLMGKTPRPTGGFTGCGYIAHPGPGQYNGVSCQFGSLGTYHPNLESFHSDWVANVSFPYSPQVFMDPQIQTPGNLPQIFMGGGAGYTPCRADCACSNMNPDCKCKSASCGYPAIQQNCMEPVEGGQYASLAECEAARELGYTGTNPALEALIAQDAGAAAAAAAAAQRMNVARARSRVMAARGRGRGRGRSPSPSPSPSPKRGAGKKHKK